MVENGTRTSRLTAMLDAIHLRELVIGEIRALIGEHHAIEQSRGTRSE